MQLKPQKFTIETFRSQADWIGNLLSPLNAFLNDLVIASTNKFTISDNLFQELKEIRFKNSSVNFPLKFRTKFQSFPQGITPIYLFDNDSSAPALEFPILKWTYSNGEVIIDSLSGLTADKTYTMRLLVIYG